jgi:hypothetical protein
MKLVRDSRTRDPGTSRGSGQSCGQCSSSTDADPRCTLRTMMRCVSAVVPHSRVAMSGGCRLGHQSELRHHLNLIEVEPSVCDGLPFDAEDLHSAAV